MNFLNRRISPMDEMLSLGQLFPEVDGTRMAVEVSSRGGSKQELMRRIFGKLREQPLADAADRMLGIDSSSEEARGYSVSRAIRAAFERNWSKAPFEQSLSDQVTTRSGQAPNGFFMPLGMATRGFTAGTAAEAGNLIGEAHDETGQYTRDPLRRLAAVGRLGATIITGRKTTLALPFFSSSTQASFQSETGTATDVTEASTDVVLAPKRCAAGLVMSKQALLQASPQLDAMITRHLVAACMEQAEFGALNGDGSGDNPTGLRSTTGIGSVVGGTNGAQIAYSHLCDLEALPGTANVDESAAGFLVNSKTRRWLRTAQMGAGLPYIWENKPAPLLGHAAQVSNLMPAGLTKGASGAVCSSLLYSANWSDLVMAIYGPGVDIVVDRVTLAGSGQLRIFASLIVGVGVICPSSFAKMDDGLTA